MRSWPRLRQRSFADPHLHRTTECAPPVFDVCGGLEQHANDVKSYVIEADVSLACVTGRCTHKMIPLHVIDSFFGQSELSVGSSFYLNDDQRWTIPSYNIEFTRSVFCAPVPSHDTVPALLQESVGQVFAASAPSAVMIGAPKPS